MKINEGNMEESLPTFIENYNVLINRLLNRSLIHTEKLEVGDLTSTNHELNNFEEEFSKVTFLYVQLIYSQNYNSILKIPIK